MADFDITVVHPEYEEFVSVWEMMRDTVEGEDEVKEYGDKYLPMKSGIAAITDGEKRKAAYDAYKDRAEFPEIVSPTVQGAVGLIHSKPTEIKIPKAMEPLREKATKDGLTLDSLHQRLTMEVMRTGRYGLMPGVNEAGDFHIAGYAAECIRNWDNPNGALNYLVLDESGDKRDPETNKWTEEKVYVENYLDEQGRFTSREWKKVKDNKGKEDWVPSEDVVIATIKGGKALDMIPFVFVGSTDLTPCPDEVPLYGLAKLALRAYRLDADYVSALHMTSEPTPYCTGVPKESAPKTIGAASMWVLPENATAGFLEFSGPGIEAQEKAIQNTLERAVMFGAQLFSDTRKTAESGEAKRIRLGSQQATLKSVAMTVAAGLEQCLRNIALWAGLNPNDVSVKPNLDFVDTALTPQEILALVSAWQSGAYSKETLFSNLQRGEVIAADRSFEDEEEKITNEGPGLGAIGA